MQNMEDAASDAVNDQASLSDPSSVSVQVNEAECVAPASGRVSSDGNDQHAYLLTRRGDFDLAGVPGAIDVQRNGQHRNSKDLRYSIGELVTSPLSRVARLFGSDQGEPSTSALSFPTTSLSVDQNASCETRMSRRLAVHRPTGWFNIADLQAQVLPASEVENRMTQYDVDSITVRIPVGLLMLDAARWQVQLPVVLEEEGEEFQLKVKDLILHSKTPTIEVVFDVYTDIILEEIGSLDVALLWVLLQDITEFSINHICRRLLDRGSSVLTALRGRLDSPLHLAARKGYSHVIKKLIHHKAPVIVTNAFGKMAIEVAVLNFKDEAAALLTKHMHQSLVRQLFQGSRCISSRLSLHDLINMPNMEQTVLAVLDTMIEPLEGQSNRCLVHYSILDADKDGRAPNDPHFHKKEKSCLHIIAKLNNKDMVYHDAVRLLLRRKWKVFAGQVFLMRGVLYLLTIIAIAVALFMATTVQDPRKYTERLDPLRLISEIIAFLAVMSYGLAEINEIRIHKWDYFKEVKNYIDILCVVLFMFIIPFRISGDEIQWLFASLSYLAFCMKAFEYAAVHRSTGSYVRILKEIFVRDLIPFLLIFAVIWISFTGAYYLASSGLVVVNWPQTSPSVNINSTSSLPTNDSNQTMQRTDPFEIYRSLLSGLEQGIAADFSIKPIFIGRYKWVSNIIFFLYLFIVVIVLLNLLIAQMSDTYANVQQDAQRSLTLDRAKIVARVEHNSVLGPVFRQKFYESSEVYDNPHGILKKWEVPPLRKVNEHLEDVDKSIKKLGKAAQETRSELLEKLHQQEEAIEEVKKIMERMLEQQQSRQ